MISRAILALTLVLIVPDVPASENPDNEPAWQTSRLFLIKRGRKLNRGYALFMKDATAPALGFSCRRENVYAYVSVVPLSLGDTFERGFRNPAEWKARYQVDEDAARDETWIWAYGGKVFVSLPDVAPDYLFKAALRGARLEFQRKGGDPVKIDIPAGDQAQFDRFIELCGLSSTDFGRLQIESGETLGRTDIGPQAVVE